MSDPASIDGLLAEQRAYYRLRAPQYDEWWQRRGRYDRGGDDAAEWDRQVASVERALATFDARGDVLELAGGTGWWTQRLTETASNLTVVDSSIETLRLNRARIGSSHVHYVVADALTWRPHWQFDHVFFSFWLSHVPRARVAAFWDLVASCLRPDGRVFVIEGRTGDPREGRSDPYVVDFDADVQLRHLGDDPATHRVVKVFYEPDELRALLDTLGWDSEIAATPWFVFGSVKPKRP